MHMHVSACVNTPGCVYYIYIFGEILELGKLSESICSQKKLCKLLHREMAGPWAVSLFLHVWIKMQIGESALTVGFYLLFRLENCK